MKLDIHKLREGDRREIARWLTEMDAHADHPQLKELWDFHSSLGSLCELIASVQFGHEEFFPRTSKSFIERVTPIDPTTASIYRDTLLAEEEGHEWIAPEILKRYATDAESQQKCLAALKKGCELFGRAIQSFNQSMPA